MRFHLLGIPHTASNHDYVACAFTQKTITLAKMLHRRGHEVIFYGNELSQVECSEMVAVTQAGDIKPPENFLDYDLQSEVYRKFHALAIAEIWRRKRPNDFLLCPWGAGHKAVADAHPDLLVCESGIGYSSGHFAPFKVFESYSILHAVYGTEAVRLADKFRWYEVVIPNAYDPEDFSFSADKSDYLLFLGMRHGGLGKGIHVAMDAAKASGLKLLCAGSSPIPEDAPDNVIYLGMVGVDQRRELLQHARAVLTPSLFMEPFCGVQAEAFLSGTPVISTDWGAFTEYNLHGVTGYRCRTHEQFVEAIARAPELDARKIRDWAENFTLERVAGRYDDFFSSVLETRTGRGWYEMHPDGNGALGRLATTLP